MSETDKLTNAKDKALHDLSPREPALKSDNRLTKKEAVWPTLRVLAKFPDWMATTRDSARISQVLNEALPEARQGNWQVLDCDVGYIRFKSQFWTALYRLTMHKAGEAQDWEVLLQGKIFPPGVLSGERAEVHGSLGQLDWHARLPALNLELEARQPEQVLASLDFLIDPDRSRQFLQDHIRASTPAYHDLQIAGCRPNVVRYKPGSRCTVVYHLEYDPALAQEKAWPELVVAKTYHGVKGQNAYDSMAALWQSPLGDGRVVKLAQPLAYLPEYKVLVQGPIREELTLKERLLSVFETPTPEMMGTLEREMRQTAAALAALHNAPVSMGQPWTWADELAEPQKQLNRLGEVLPQLKAAAAPLLNRLNQLASETPADPPVPTHGTFRPAQVLLYQGEIGFIDFDSFVQSEPANDLALFLSTVMSIAMTPDEQTERPSANAATRKTRFESAYGLCEQFLDAYQQDHPVSRQRVALWEALDMFTFVMHNWTKIKGFEIEETISLLEQFLAAKGIEPTR